MVKANIDKLMELKQLYEQGILTKEEMEAEKAKILKTSTSQEESPMMKESSVETKDYSSASTIDDNTPCYSKYKKSLIGAFSIVIVAVIAFLYFQNEQASLNVSNSTKEVSLTSETKQETIYLVNSPSEDFHYIFSIDIQGETVSGNVRLAGDYPLASLNGTIDHKGMLILHQNEEGKEVNRFEGSLDADGFNGTLFFTDGNKPIPFTAKRMTKENVDKLDNEAKKSSTDDIELAQLAEDDNPSSKFEELLNSCKWIKHDGGFQYPDFFGHYEKFLDEIPASVDVYTYDSVDLCYWGGLGAWSVTDEFPYLSPTETVKNVTYRSGAKGIASGYTNSGKIYYLKQKFYGEDVIHSNVLVLINPPEYSKSVEKLTNMVAKW
jgi:hypothetical protein